MLLSLSASHTSKTFLPHTWSRMSSAEMTVLKPEAMKSFIWLQCSDGSHQQVEEEVAMFCPMICQEILQTGMGSSKNFAIALPQRVTPAILCLILDYCRFHQVPGRSNKERKYFDERFAKLDTKRLCELTSAADCLQLKPLVDLTSRALARMIEGKTPEEIRETFHLPNDLTEEEKLEPLKNMTDDPRIRLLNRLYARKRKELKERQKVKNLEVEEKKDDRSVDELLSFINGDADSKDGRASRKKKNKRRNDLMKDSSDNEQEKESKEEATKAGSSSPSQISRLQDQVEDAFDSRAMIDDGDDGLDPLMKEELDREVEDFARRLNCDWPERMQEILSLSRERRLVSNLTTGNSSNQRCRN
ncbi:SKP1-like protein 21 isoform X2 [Phalaenopsis equestris]|uniref:SKP1-like protein 21 isoform X2 n=1 Tax=Phalaenopsis equestris TaxID=78828 RepID=UPI0009E6028F|nr:SKP1-like protein 21 isoform X2 [Phalaenopsis equestris]